jgi:uncharacterized protein (TIGR02231 family)
MPELDAPIRDVTVYSDRALITRQGKLELEAGEHEIRVNNLPQFIQESLRAAGSGPQGTRILNVDITTAFYSRPPETELLTLQTELDLLIQKQQLLKARQDALNDRRNWLRALGEQSRDFARGLAQGQMKPQDCADFFSFTSDQALKDAQAAQDLEIQLKQVKQDIEAKKRELTWKQGTGPSDRLAALITVELAEAGTFELEISYLIMNASWYPQYDVRVQSGEDEEKGEVELTYIGMVQQKTGENWEHVQLSLSTARPSLASILPELQPWYLSNYQPPIPRRPAMAAMQRAHLSRGVAKKAQSEGADEDEEQFGGAENYLYAPAMAMPAAPLPVAAEIATTTVEKAGAAFVFRAGRSVDIPSDNSPHKTTIARDGLPCAFDYVTAPAIEENAHLRATITNTTERVLLAGKTNIFLSGEYVGTSAINQIAPTEELKLFLGIDDNIKVKRELIEKGVDKGNLLQRDVRVTTYAYRITVHNYTALAKKIVVRDHLPVSNHERIKIKIQTIQPTPAERDKLEMLEWRFPLPADKEQKIEYRFTVEYPQDMQVIGLPS